MDTHDEFQASQALDLDTLAGRIEWQLKRKSFYIVYEDEIERYWPIEKMTDRERERQIQAFAESHGMNAFMHRTDFDRTRVIFLPQ